MNKSSGYWTILAGLSAQTITPTATNTVSGAWRMAALFLR